MNISNDLFRTLNGTKRSESKLTKATKRLSSGNRINSAADDAAGLAISEKLRAIDRGLRQGMRNTSDGINYLDTVDGCAQEMNEMLHRLKEIAVEAANGTLTDVDREALDLEYQQILDEFGSMADSENFNGIPLMERHQPEYEKNVGNVVHTSPIVIGEDNSVLKIGYIIDGESLECVVNIAEGEYTADELADEIDNQLYDLDSNLIIGVNENNEFTLQCENGKLSYISGSAASIFYDTVLGSTDGYLLGVTRFANDTTAVMDVIAGKNNVMEFRLGNKDDTKYTITLDVGTYNRPQLTEHINQKIAEAGLPCEVEAVMYTNDSGHNVIGLRSEQTITGLSGNFLMIDEGDPIHSPIYDICCYSTLQNSEAKLTGTRDVSAGVEIERGRNDYFVIDAGWYKDGKPYTQTLRINLLDDGEDLRQYTGRELIERIQEQLDAAGAMIKADLSENGGIYLSTTQYGQECKVDLVESDAPSDYMIYDLFDAGALNKLEPSRSYSSYTPAYCKGGMNLGSSVIVTSLHNKLSYTITYASGADS